MRHSGCAQQPQHAEIASSRADTRLSAQLCHRQANRVSDAILGLRLQPASGPRQPACIRRRACRMPPRTVSGPAPARGVASDLQSTSPVLCPRPLCFARKSLLGQERTMRRGGKAGSYSSSALRGVKLLNLHPTHCYVRPTRLRNYDQRAAGRGGAGRTHMSPKRGVAMHDGDFNTWSCRGVQPFGSGSRQSGSAA